MLAFYKFRFYTLDQPVAVGDEAEFVFYPDPIYGGVPGAGIYRHSVLVFANETLGMTPGERVFHRCRILSITHPRLGAVSAIRVERFDSYVMLASGVELHVNTEEHPGRIENRDEQIDDWAFTIDLEPVGDAIGA